MAFFLVGSIFVLLVSLFLSNLAVSFWGLICVLALTLITKFLFKSNRDLKLDRHLITIFIISMGFMLVVYYGYIAEYKTPYYLPGLDDLESDNYAEYTVEKGYYTISDMMDDNTFILHNSKGFILLISYLMRISYFFGEYHTIIFRMINITSLIIIGLLMLKYSIKKNTFSTKQNLLILYCVALFPNALFISSHVYRDTLCALFIVLCFCIWDNFPSKRFLNKIIIITVTILLFYISYWFRSINVLYLGSAVILNILLSDESIRNTKQVKKKNFIYITLSLITLFIVIFYAGDYLISRQSSYISGYTEGILSSNAGSNSLSLLVYSQDLLPIGVFLRIIYYLASPFTFDVFRVFHYFSDITTFLNTFVSLGTIGFLFFLPYLIKNLLRQDKVTIIFEIIFISIIVTTMGFRHIIFVYPFMFYLIIRQYNVTSKNKKVEYLLYTFGFGVIGMVFYFIVKLI